MKRNSWMRSQLERGLKRFVYRRRMPDPFSRHHIWVTPAGGLRFAFRRMSQIDPELIRLGCDLIEPGMTVWDVGAHIGLFSLVAADRSGPTGSVVAFEADARMASLNQRTASEMTSAAPITVVPIAVSAENNISEFTVVQGSTGTSHLAGYGLADTGGATATFRVLTLSIDSVTSWIPAPDLIKIDVEGAELEVIKGARTLLSTRQPILLVEVGHDNSGAVTDVLKHIGYRLFDGSSADWRNVEVTQAVWSTVAIGATS